MAHTVVWPKKSFFYPIGNTPAICLTQDFAPEEHADVLLLGCGDPRHILYTTYADIAAPDRKLDFTCCDHEPAVLARNIILYSLVFDGVSPDRLTKIWNIFYHFYLDKASLDLLLSQCQTLVELSANLDTWNASRYGSFLRVCSRSVLVELRRHWSLYSATENLSAREKKNLKDSFNAGTKAVLKRYDSSGYKPSSTTKKYDGDLVEVPPDHFLHFWTWGVTFTDKEAISSATSLNPTFAYSLSGRGFEVHYASDPMLCFHIASALSPTKPATTTNAVEAANAEFQTWCSAFNAKASATPSPKIVIRFFIGDALACCRALQVNASSDSIETGVYQSFWGGSQIILDGGDYISSSSRRAPANFNMIDTTNLSDHLAPLNILLTAMPLLRLASSSVINTNSFLNPKSDDSFMGRMCADIPTLSLILGVVPIAYMSNFRTESHISVIYPKNVGYIQHYDHIAWRAIPCPERGELPFHSPRNQPLKFDPIPLAQFLFGIYLKMFASDNPFAFTKQEVRAALHKSSIVHYTRGTFAALIQMIKERVETNWSQVIRGLFDFIEEDTTLLMGRNNYQDLCCELHLRGIHSVPILQISHSLSELTNPKMFRGWSIVPPIICIAMEIPRKHLKPLEAIHANDIGTPILHCEIMGPTFHNIFSCFQPVFGKISTTGSGSGMSSTLKEDLEAWSGQSPLIVTFYAPAWILANNPDATKIRFSVRSTPASTAALMHVLGLELSIFSTLLTDEKHIRILPTRPHNPMEFQTLGSYSYLPKQTPQASTNVSNIENVKVVLDDAGSKAVYLTSRANIVDEKARAALTNKVAVTTKQVSSFAMLVTFGDFQELLTFPFAIDGTNPKLRIARKSFYIEVDVALSELHTRAMSLSPFPVTMRGPIPTTWNMPYLNLDCLPILDLDSPDRLEWLKYHTIAMFSHAKENMGSGGPGHTLFEIKRAICIILNQSAGLEGKKYSVFALSEPDNGGIYTVIFVNCLRLDLASRTIVADACVLPLNDSLVEKLHLTLGALNEERLPTITTHSEEVRAWKQLLPALAERCRRWAHNERCEYITKGIPISVENAVIPICGCGRGKELGSFLDSRHGRKLAPYVTRIALGPLFPVVPLDSDNVDKANKRYSKASTSSTPPKADTDPKCAKCGGPGKPKLLICSKCKAISYCSADCQREDWKAHKIRCKK